MKWEVEFLFLQVLIPLLSLALVAVAFILSMDNQAERRGRRKRNPEEKLDKAASRLQTIIYDAYEKYQ